MIGSLLRPWRTAATWNGLAFLTTSLPVGIVGFTLTVTLLAVSAGLVVILPAALVVAWLLFVVTAGLGRLERSRIAALLALDLEWPHPPLLQTSAWRRLLERVGTPSRWREIAYFLVALPLALACFVATIVAWCGSLALLALPLYVGSLPGDSAELGLFDVGTGAPAVVAAFVGLCGLILVAPWATIGAAAAWRVTGRRLLGPSPAAGHEELARVEARRVAAVDAAEAERRRIERDLHDGAQARLVSVAMDLGRAEELLDEDPERARALIADAHRDTRSALSELRDLVRGFHPAILEDRGLDAALSAIVARLPFPTELRIDVERRPPDTIESAAYFVVVESLTNVAKHSGATHATVSIARRGDRLAIDVTDDGHGGATAATGGGLAGIRERVEGLGGWMHLLSPAGGPTTVLVELPCAS